MRLQSGIPVDSIAVGSIAEPVVIIAAFSSAEPHHVMWLQCWVALKQKYSFSYLCEKFFCFSRKKLTKFFGF
jgi:hypothetical protein